MAVAAFPSATYTAADIAAGRLSFVPIANLIGAGAASLGLTVLDDGGTAGAGRNADAAPKTLRFDILAVNDAPSGTDKAIIIDEDVPYTLGLAGIVLLLLPLTPGLGTAKFGAQIWIQVGPYSFQPAEAAKVLLAIAFAAYLVEKRDVLALAGYRVLGIDLPRARDLGPILLVWLLSLAILVLQRDLGTSLLFFGLFVMMLYVATERAGWPVLGCSCSGPGPTSAT